ncbi:MAG TPA: YdeI/OmpD-associated family protein [Actinomycetota bacterium]
MDVTTFETPEAFRRWLEQHHDTETELWVGFHRKATGRPSMTWAESVDEALCFGWIDGKTKRIDEGSFTIRFTPRRKGSVWSQRNVGRVEQLTREARMHPAGVRAFEARREDRSGIYSYEQRHRAALPRPYERRFRAERKAWAWFEGKAPSYRQAAIRWVMTAKKEETRERRLRQLIEASAAGETIPSLTSPGRSPAR